MTPISESGHRSDSDDEPMQKLEEDAKNVSQKVDYFSKYITW